VGLEQGPLSLVSNLRSYLNEKIAAPCLHNQSYGRRDSLCLPRNTLCPLKLALASLTGGDRSVGIVRLRTKTTEFFFFMTDVAVSISKHVDPDSVYSMCFQFIISL
jgi:hypothetical protein